MSKTEPRAMGSKAGCDRNVRDSKSVTSSYADDAIMLSPNMPMAIGKEAIREATAPNFDIPGFSVKWQPMKIEVARSGDLGYAIGTFEGTMNDPEGNPMALKGKYIEIW